MKKSLILFIFLSHLVNFASAAEVANSLMTLSSNSTLDNGIYPVLYTCDGEDVSPELIWKNNPTDTQSFAIVMKDVDAPGGVFYHWVIYNIPTTIHSFIQNQNPFPTEVTIGKNSWQKNQYSGPCPPKGTLHHYLITLYALNKSLNLPLNLTGDKIEIAIKDHILRKAQLTVIYSRWIK